MTDQSAPFFFQQHKLEAEESRSFRSGAYGFVDRVDRQRRGISEYELGDKSGGRTSLAGGIDRRVIPRSATTSRKYSIGNGRYGE